MNSKYGLLSFVAIVSCALLYFALFNDGNVVEPVVVVDPTEKTSGGINDNALGDTGASTLLKHETEQVMVTQASAELDLEVSTMNGNLPSGLPADAIAQLPEGLLFDVENNPELQRTPLEVIGFTPDGIEAVMSKDTKATLSIDDMPPGPLKDDLRKRLEFIKNNGFDVLDEYTVGEILGIMSYIAGDSEIVPGTSFEQSQLPPSITDNYQYIGYTYPNFSINTDVAQMGNGTIRRIFSRLNSDSLLIVQESSTKSGGAVLTKEFVNTEVNGEPAIFGFKQDINGGRFATLNWTQTDYAFSLYQVGDLDMASEILPLVGRDISSKNMKSDSQPETNTLPDIAR